MTDNERTFFAGHYPCGECQQNLIDLPFNFNYLRPLGFDSSEGGRARDCERASAALTPPSQSESKEVHSPLTSRWVICIGKGTAAWREGEAFPPAIAQWFPLVGLLRRPRRSDCFMYKSYSKASRALNKGNDININVYQVTGKRRRGSMPSHGQLQLYIWVTPSRSRNMLGISVKHQVIFPQIKLKLYLLQGGPGCNGGKKMNLLLRDKMEHWAWDLINQHGLPLFVECSPYGLNGDNYVYYYWRLPTHICDTHRCPVI